MMIRTAEGDDSFDLRQAYVDISDYSKCPWGVKMGREILSYGDERLVGAFEWNNFGRTFDAAKVTYKTKGFTMDAFTSTPVVITRQHSASCGETPSLRADRAFSSVCPAVPDGEFCAPVCAGCTKPNTPAGVAQRGVEKSFAQSRARFRKVARPLNPSPPSVSALQRQV